MPEDYLDSCVIAIPVKAYEGMERSEAIQKYRKMSGPDFSKQFETSEEVILNTSEIAVYLNKPIELIRTVAPFTRFDKWNGKEAKQSMMGSLIYTELDGFPIAEYCAIRSYVSGLGIGADTARYFMKNGWYAEIYRPSAGFVEAPDFSKTGEQPLLDVEPSVLSQIEKLLK